MAKSYWEKRFLELWLFNEHLDKRYKRQMAKRLTPLEKSLTETMNEFIDRWSTQDGISAADIEVLMSRKEQKTWSMTLKEFRKKAIEGGYENELNREYFKSRISHLSQLKAQLYFQAVEVAVNERKQLEEHLLKQKEETFFRTIYEISNRGNIDFGINWGKYNENVLRRSLTTPWEGSNFSKRVWGNLTSKLPERLTSTLSQAAVNGWGIEQTKREFAKNIEGITQHRMYTLVQTESTHIAEMAAMDGYRETGIDKWEWMATLEVHTCKFCGGMDGRTFEVGGEQDPPPGGSHPNCRCRSLPSIEGWKHLKRWTRDPITGKGERIDYVTYEDWKKEKEKVA